MKLILTIVAISLLTITSSACDICGCSGAGNTLGILPHYQRSFIGMRTLYQSYENVNPLYESDNIQDYYLQTNLWGRYALGKRWQIIGVLPYNINHRTYDDNTIQGIGDVSLLVNYSLINTMDSLAIFRHHLMIGGGAKLPTGNFMEAEKFSDVPANFRLGTGSFDALFNLVYTVQYQGFGLSINAAYQLTTENQTRSYKFGNKTNVTSFLFYQQRKENWAFQPYIGGSFEHLEKDTHYYAEQVGTGGTAIYGLVGTETAYKQVSVGVNYQMPLKQNYAAGEIENRGRLTASITYVF